MSALRVKPAVTAVKPHVCKLEWPEHPSGFHYYQEYLKILEFWNSGFYGNIAVEFTPEGDTHRQIGQLIVAVYPVEFWVDR